jgi:hypothetical protein
MKTFVKKYNLYLDTTFHAFFKISPTTYNDSPVTFVGLDKDGSLSFLRVKLYITCCNLQHIIITVSFRGSYTLIKLSICLNCYLPIKSIYLILIVIFNGPIFQEYSVLLIRFRPHYCCCMLIVKRNVSFDYFEY